MEKCDEDTIYLATYNKLGYIQKMAAFEQLTLCKQRSPYLCKIGYL